MVESDVTVELDPSTKRPRAEGSGEHVSVDGLIRQWQSLANEVGHYTATIDDYTNGVFARDALEPVLGWGSSRTVAVIGSAISAADDQFRDSTTDDHGDAISRYFRIDARSGWWWRGSPNPPPSIRSWPIVVSTPSPRS